MPVKKVKALTSLGLVLFFATGSFAQSLPDSVKQKIDSLYSKWNTSNTPGCTVGIIRNDSLIFSKGYGMANLEYSIPNTPGTIYHMASVSKQFTAYAIVLLASQGKLSLDDDIHKYLSSLTATKDINLIISNTLSKLAHYKMNLSALEIICQAVLCQN